MSVIATFYDHAKEIARQENRSLGDTLRLIKSLGVDAVEISMDNILGREDEVGHELAYADLDISSIPCFLNFGRDSDIETQVSPILEAAGFLGAKRFLVIPGFLGEEDSPEEKEAQIVRMEEGINRMAELAGSAGISLVMEDFDSNLSPFSTIQGLLRFTDHCPQLSCAFDTGNFRYSAEDELEAYEALRERITHVHLKDRAYTCSNEEKPKVAVDGKNLYPAPVGYGDLKLGEIVSRLRRDGYDGTYTLEFYDSNRTLEYLEKSVAWLQEQLKEI